MRIFSFLFFFFSVFIGTLSGEGVARKGPWYWLKKAVYFKKRKEPEKALEALEFAEDRSERFPELFYLRGKIQADEGDLVLSEQNFEKALRYKDYFFIPEEKYEVLFDLGRLNYLKGDTKLFEKYLFNIVDDEIYLENKGKRGERFATLLMDRGIDRLFNLYRYRLTYSLKAHEVLGEYYYRKRNYDRSELLLLRALLAVFSRAFNEEFRINPTFSYPLNQKEILKSDPDFFWSLLEERMKRVIPNFHVNRNPKTLKVDDPEKELSQIMNILSRADPSFRVTGFYYVIRKFQSRKNIRDYLEETSFYKIFYYVSLILYKKGFFEQAREMWLNLSFFEDPGSPYYSWAKRASLQLKSPQREPELDDLTFFFP